jgi:NAD(P)H-hydrate epimerase
MTAPSPALPPIVTPEQMRALDQRAMQELGLPAAVLMETAGRALARTVEQRLGPADGRFVTVLAGAGNNGGDGFVAARVLHLAGWRVELYGAGDPGKMTPETQLHYTAMRRCGVDCRWSKEAPDGRELQGIRRSLGRAAAIIDALVGIGPSEALREPLATFAAQLDGRHRGLTIAADLPSGLHAGTGAVLGAAVRCHVVVAMGAPKAGLFLGQGPDFWQELEVAEIGLPPAWLAELPHSGRVLGPELAGALLPPRPPQSHKGRFGHLFVVAGSPGKAGAALLAAGAAMRTGVGLCTLGTSGEVRARLEAEIPDLMVEAVRGGASEIKRIEKLLQRKSALAVGPGLGTGAAEVDLVQRLLALSEVPAVLDADALTALAGKPELAQPAAGRLVLTPHPGEMATLLGTTVEAVEADRLAAAKTAAGRWTAVVVLKGSRTLVVAPDGRWGVYPTQNPALAKAGAGDVLTGVIGALLAQGLAPFEAACLAVAVHAEAGKVLRDRFGLRAGLASDLLALLPELWRQLEVAVASQAR